MTYSGADLSAYLLTFTVDRAPIVTFLDSRPEVKNWFAISANAVLIASDSDVTALTALIHLQFPWLWFLLTKVQPGSVNGWVNQEVWDFINSPKSSGRWS